MKRFIPVLLGLFFACSLSLQAQEADSTATEESEEEFDFSQFSGDFEVETENTTSFKSFCSSKIAGGTPTKLISVGYDYQLPFDVVSYEGTDREETSQSGGAQGLRVRAMFPVISKNSFVLSLGAQYMETHYNLEEGAKESPLGQSLSQSALRSAGLSVLLFKPFNEKHFFIYSASHDLNGDYWLDELQPLSYMKHSITGIFGWKKGERRQLGIGLSRTYRVGELNYIPVLLYNYTHSNDKWGIEAVLPARGHYRRNFSSRSMLRLGYELEGNSYRLQNRNGEFGAGREDLELRRSELRFQAIYERSLSGFIWLSVQAGYRYNYNFNVDDGEFFRGFFGDQTYEMENILTNPLYFQVSLNLVSP